MKAKLTRIMALTMAVVMCLGMSVCAADSPSGSTVFRVRGVARALDANGQDVTSKISLVDTDDSSIPEEYQAPAAEIRTEDGLEKCYGFRLECEYDCYGCQIYKGRGRC